MIHCRQRRIDYVGSLAGVSLVPVLFVEQEII